jgi:hypothetical protein
VEIKEEPLSVALIGTKIKVKSDLDPHYKNLAMKVNESVITDESVINVNTDINVVITCEPKQYNVTFSLVGKGNAVSNQLITYLHKVTKPLSQY